MSVGAYTIFGFDVSPSRRNGSLVAGQLLPDGRIGIGILETFSSQVAIDELAMAKKIKDWCDIYKPRLVCYDKRELRSIITAYREVAVQDGIAEFKQVWTDEHVVKGHYKNRFTWID